MVDTAPSMPKAISGKHHDITAGQDEEIVGGVADQLPIQGDITRGLNDSAHVRVFGELNQRIGYVQEWKTRCVQR